MLFFTNRTQELVQYRPVIVMARGHSGTRILSWALTQLGINMGTLESNPAADAQDLRFTEVIKRIASKAVYEPPTASPKTSSLHLFQKRVDQYISWLKNTKAHWGWKFPETYLIPNYVETTFPHAQLIHMVRDGRDIAFKNHATDRPKKIGYHVLKQAGALNESPHYRQAALSWAYQVDRFDEWAQHTQLPIHHLTFEELCAEPITTLQKVCEFLNIEMTDQCRKFLSNNVQPQKIAQYKNENPQIVDEIEHLIHPQLQRWNYL